MPLVPESLPMATPFDPSEDPPGSIDPLGTLALAGIPPFAGFFSKDEVLAAALARNPYLFALGAVAAAMTAFYMARALVMTFHGKPADMRKYDHAHESPAAMKTAVQAQAGR